MKRIELTVADDAVPAVLQSLSSTLTGDTLNSLKIEPVRTRASRAKTPAPESANGQQ